MSPVHNALATVLQSSEIVMPNMSVLSGPAVVMCKYLPLIDLYNTGASVAQQHVG